MSCKRTKWYEVCWAEGTHWTLHFALPTANYEPFNRDEYRAKITIGFWKVFCSINLWKVNPIPVKFSEWDHRYGITFFEREVHWHWGDTWVKSLPWDWTIVRSDLLLPSGDMYYRNIYKNRKCVNKEYHWYQILEGKEQPHSVDVPTNAVEYVNLTHTTKNGKIQNATIRLCGIEREWRWVWFAWLPWPRLIHRVVDCESNIELGERASWKGGMIGWSSEWKKGESLTDAFWRWYSSWNGT